MSTMKEQILKVLESEDYTSRDIYEKLEKKYTLQQIRDKLTYLRHRGWIRIVKKDKTINIYRSADKSFDIFLENIKEKPPEIKKLIFTAILLSISIKDKKTLEYKIKKKLEELI